ncbi:pfs ankyrin repeats & 6-phosphofructo-2-kinase [Fusarium albosuccineum]|uniref:Pfs ankyrin repeats & 6-phosphofructo-2-kinase n=1 Tax=Fusarium albosuccineum TaxID=1237068 RepID=A0A8H4PJ29_9HYPO|nr:pfs ankyrin repeats & 6-phosphofructo-2-kinase [Fusarium albosuccineum]
MIELDPALLHHGIAAEGGYNPASGENKGVVLVDDRDYALKNSGEVVQSKVTGEDLVELGQIVALRKGRTQPLNDKHLDDTNKFISEGFVVYKSIGVSLTDLTAGNAVLALSKKKQARLIVVMTRSWPWVLWSFVSGVKADDDGLSDFSNDLATDLAPLLTLFGDAITKQYLSESTSFLDHLIFAMGPIGILTAIVSTIRVCGHSSLRAFVGRSQEGEGTIEAELCTSTSRDVSELFNRGGIARVLGRPAVLELVYSPARLNETLGADGGLDLSKAYFSKPPSWRQREGWKRVQGSIFERLSTGWTLAGEFAPSPNLSLNVGIIKRPKWVFVAIAITGVLLQAGVVTLAGVGVWILGWNLSGGRSPASKNYAPFMFICGTSLIYSPYNVPKSRLFWIQPGPQVIGDQSFDSYGYIEDPANPVQIWMSSRKEFHDDFELKTLFAVSVVLIGYIAQFIGLRGMKAWVSLSQLGVCVVMSILRGCLRMQRLDKRSNQLADKLDLVSGYELEWISHEIVPQETQWDINPYVNSKISDSSNDTQALPPKMITEESEPESEHNFHPHSDETCPSNAAPFNLLSHQETAFYNLLSVRRRLARLTGHGHPNNSQIQRWKDEYVRVRVKAHQIAESIQQIARKLLPEHVPEPASVYPVQPSHDLSIPAASFAQDLDRHVKANIAVKLGIPLKLLSQRAWKVDAARIEAILGLWVWSLSLADDALFRENVSAERRERIPVQRIVSANPDDERLMARKLDMEKEIGFWFPIDDVLLRSIIPVHHGKCYSLRSLWSVSYGHVCKERVIPMREGRKDDRHLMRYCGWNAVQGAVEPGYQGDILLFTREIDASQDSLLNACAQDLFAALIVPLASHVSFEKTTITEHGNSTRFENRSLNTFVDAFMENGLGNQHDAFITILPALRGQLPMPGPEEMVAIAISEADRCRHDFNYYEAHYTMRWACTRSSFLQGDQTKLFHQALRGFGEVNRHAFEGGTWKNNGFIGYFSLTSKWMIETFASRAQDDPVVKEILDCYQELDRRLQNSLVQVTFGWYEDEPRKSELHLKLLQCLEDVDRTETLYCLCLVGRNAFKSTELRPALPLAVRNNWGEVIKDILEMQADPNGLDNDGRTAVSHAAEHGFEHHIKTLIDHQALLDEPDKQQRTPLYYAAREGHERIVKILINHGSVDINKTDQNGHNALWAASKGGHRAVMEALFERGVSPDYQQGKYDEATFFYAAHHGHMDLAVCMLDKTPFRWEEDPHLRRNLLEVAVSNEYSELIDKLQTNQADAHLSTWTGWTALGLAAHAGHLEIMDVLLRHLGSYLSKHPDVCDEAIRRAVSGKQEATILKLLQRGASPNPEPVRDDSLPLLHTPAVHYPENFIRLLIENGAKVTQQGQDINILPDAAYHYREGAVRLLVQAGADVNMPGTDPDTPLIMMSRDPRPESVGMVRTLLELGADIEALTLDQRTALSFAAEEGLLDTVCLLLEHGACVHAKDIMGRTPLHWCCVSGRPHEIGAVIEALLKAGADVDAKSEDGRTPLSEVVEHGVVEMVKVLLGYGADLTIQDRNGRDVYDWATDKSVWREEAEQRVAIVQMLESHRSRGS